MSAELIYQIVSVVVIPFVVLLARKLKLPTKWAPVFAFVIAVVLVSVAKLFGVELDVNNVAQTIITALATAGISVLGYDTIKGFTTPK